MKDSIRFFLAAWILAAGCSGVRLNEQQTTIETLRKQLQEHSDQAKFRSGRITALEDEKKDLEAQLSASHGRIASLEKSNQDLSTSLESNKGQLMRKVKELIAEKDEMSRKMTDALKEKIGLKATLRNKMQTAGEAAAALSAERDALRAELEPLKAEKEEAEAEALRKLEKAKADGASLAAALRAEGLANQVLLVRSGEALKLTLYEAPLFKLHEAKLTEAGNALLDKIGRAMKAVIIGRTLRVEGHHDNSPVKGALFGGKSTPWDLSSARAAAVTRYLTETVGFDPQRVYCAGYGEFRPVSINDTSDGRAANRRVVLALEPSVESSAPAAAPPSPGIENGRPPRTALPSAPPSPAPASAGQ
ncbi:MAG: OmpA family protein [Elusimicrobia bacterium]|nr:OmpA family protein [Elusimicrobiota bacterium]